MVYTGSSSYSFDWGGGEIIRWGGGGGGGGGGAGEETEKTPNSIH